MIQLVLQRDTFGVHLRTPQNGTRVMGTKVQREYNNGMDGRALEEVSQRYGESCPPPWGKARNRKYREIRLA